MDTIETYSKAEIKKQLLDIYHKQKYNFILKENTLDNIINRWKLNTRKFTKYNALDNMYINNNELILWDHRNIVIYLQNKKKELTSEYFIWSHDQIISRARISNNFFIDGTFHTVPGFSQLLIILFKDLIINEYIPCFYILMSNRYEELYNIVLQSIKTILTQYDIINLNIETITSDSEKALVNSLNNNFDDFQRVSCWFHMKQNIIKNAKQNGFFNPKSKFIDVTITKEIITQLCTLPLEYKGDMTYFDNKIKILESQYGDHYSHIIKYFYTEKRKYFEDNSFNYNMCPPDVRSNSIIEHYNSNIKKYFGEKKETNWIIFMNFIKTEIQNIIYKLSKNENKNIKYYSKYTKFGNKKYNNNKLLRESSNNKINHDNNIIKPFPKKINETWLINRGENCRYICFTTLYYFIFLSYINKKKETDYINLKYLNELVLKLSENVDNRYMNDIIEFFQINKYDIDNKLLDEINELNEKLLNSNSQQNELTEQKRNKLINNLKNNYNINYYSSGYITALFNIFKNLEDFCIVEKKFEFCTLCRNKQEFIIKPYYHFFIINEENIKEDSIMNIFIKKYKKYTSYNCLCKKTDDYFQTTICEYQIISYPIFLMILFDLSYENLLKYSKNIFNLLEQHLILNFDTEYNLKGLVIYPYKNHYSSIIFYPVGSLINTEFKSNKIYIHDSLKNNGKIIEINNINSWKNEGIPYLAIYAKEV